MKLAYSTLACPRWTVEEAVKAAVADGYEAIEWRLADGELIAPETSQTVRQRLREVPAAHGIEVACLDTSCRVVQGSAQERAAQIEAGQRMIDMAAEIGAPFIRLFGGPLPAGMTREAILGPSAEVLHALGEYGASRHVTALIETHDAWSQSEDVLALFHAAASPAVKILWDIHHTYRSGEAPADSVARLGSAIGYIHVKDGRPLAGNPAGWELCLIHEGVVPLGEAFAALKQSGYDGYISLEWEKKWHPEIPEPEVALPQAAPLLRQLW